MDPAGREQVMLHRGLHVKEISGTNVKEELGIRVKETSESRVKEVAVKSDF